MATIRRDREEAFNRWYDEEHVPQVLQWKGGVSAKALRAEYDTHFGDASERARFAYEQVFP